MSEIAAQAVNGFLPVILLILGAIFSAVGTQLYVWLLQRKWIARNELARAVLVRIKDATVTAVKELEQTMVPLAKAKSADGKLTTEDMLSLRDQAIEKAKTYIGEYGLAEARRVYPDEGVVQRLLGANVEAAVLDLKARSDVPKVEVRP
jgi:hypothetical protein